MTIEFIKEQEGLFAYEFDASADYNLHIEVDDMEGKRGVRVLQKGDEDENYALAYEFFPNKALQESEIFDMDFQHGIYPKKIRVEVFSEPIVAKLNM